MLLFHVAIASIALLGWPQKNPKRRRWSHHTGLLGGSGVHRRVARKTPRLSCEVDGVCRMPFEVASCMNRNPYSQSNISQKDKKNGMTCWVLNISPRPKWVSASQGYIYLSLGFVFTRFVAFLLVPWTGVFNWCQGGRSLAYLTTSRPCLAA